ncbi:MAG: TatD family hydrolase [Acidobacteriaceae bacterium]
MYLVDSHAHLDSARYDEDRDDMLRRSYEAGVRMILSIGIGDGPAFMHQALELSHHYAGRPGFPVIYASAGVHPQEAALADDLAMEKLANLAKDDRCIAIGEIGLDYYHADNPPIDVQKSVFLRQMEIAAAAKLPILIHCRPSDGATPEALSKFGTADAWDDTLTLIEQHWKPHNLGGVLHCFTGTIDHARRALDCGFMISFAGNITYPKAQNIRDAAAIVPEDRILVETDAPFLAPIPNRGQRNEPAWTVYTAQKLAEVRGLDEEAVASITTENFLRFFSVTHCLQ